VQAGRCRALYGVSLSARDRELLAFAAEQRLVLPAQVAALLGVSAGVARGRLAALAGAGLLRRPARRPYRVPAGFQIARAGLEAIGSPYRAPSSRVAAPDHDIAVGWLWLAARGGTFGPLREVISERHLRSADAQPERAGAPLGVRVGGYGPRGAERVHYPDLVLVDPGGRRIAVELELSRKGVQRRETILAGYAADRRIDAVLYLVEDRPIGRAIAASARKLGISDLIHVQRVQLGSSGARSGPAVERSRGIDSEAVR
jgi:hypothetical protein